MSRIALSIAVLFAIACGSGDAPAPTVAAPSAAPAPAAAAPQSDQEVFVAWFDELKAAAKAKDYDKLASMSEMPFTTRGPMDSDAEITFDAKEFPVFAKHWLGQTSQRIDNGTALDDWLQADLDKELSRDHDKAQLAEGNAWIGNGKFHKVGGEWKWYFAYTADGMADAIQAELGGSGPPSRPNNKPASTTMGRPGDVKKRPGRPARTTRVPNR